MRRKSTTTAPRRPGPGRLHRFPSPPLLKDQEYATALRRFGISLGPPKGIVIASAHWHTMRPVRVTGSRKPTLLHDYGEYPAWLNRISYACTGSPTLATDVVNALKEAGQPGVVDMSQGLDYSTWMPLSLMYSSGKVPIVEISLPAGGSPGRHDGGWPCAGTLRQACIMLVGSGAVVNNPYRARHDSLAGRREDDRRLPDDLVAS